MCGGDMHGDVRRYTRAELEIVAVYAAVRALGLPVEQTHEGGRRALAVVTEAGDAAAGALAAFDQGRGAALGFTAEQLSGTRRVQWYGHGSEKLERLAGEANDAERLAEWWREHGQVKS